MTTEVPLRAEGLVHGGELLARHEGQVVFLRGAAPGDLVSAELRPGGKGFLRGVVKTVLERGPQRVTPPCPIVERCGGCPIQQVSYPAQLAQKQLLAQDALERIDARLNLGCLSPGEWHRIFEKGRFLTKSTI